MMDRIAFCVLEKICGQAGIGKYAIVAEEEFFEDLPEGVEMNDGEFKKAIKALVSDGYIDVKFNDGGTLCVAPLKYPPEDTPPTLSSAKPAKRRTVALAVFFAAFAGGALGSLIVSLIFLLVRLC